MNTHQGVMGARRISIKTQISSSSSAQQNQVHTPKSRENSQIQLNKQISINNNNTNMEGVVTESDSCLNMVSNNQFVINSRHAAFMQDDCLSNPSSQNTIGQIGITTNILSQQYRSENITGNQFQQGPFQNNTNTFNNSTLQGQILQQNTQYVNAFKDKRLTPTMRRANEDNSFNYENNFFNQQKWKNNILKQSKIAGFDDGGGGENDSHSNRNTVREFQAIEMNRHRIDLQQMQLQRLPSLVQEMKSSLQDLNLSYNNFIIFPQELCQFLHLKVLRLDFNYFCELPEQIAFLKYLEELSVSHNCLKELPGTLQNMSNLKILNVGQNNIQYIGQEITNIKKLEVLYIYNNEFTVLPAKLRNLIHLKEFGLDWFRYTKPPIDTLLTRPAQNSLFSKLFDLCGQHAINAKPSISFKDFVKQFSLIDGAIDFTKVDARGRTVAFLATESEELGVLKALLEENRDILNYQDREGQTLLTQALIDNKVRSIKFLLDNGADPRKGNTHLGSSLHMATSKLNQELVLRFLSLGVNPNTVDFEGSTPLHIAFSIFQKDSLAAKVISEQLLSNGADPNILNKDLWTPLHIAVRKNQKDAIKYALQYNEKIKQKLIVTSPTDSKNNVMNNASGLSFINNDDDQSGFYTQDQRDSQRRLPSYKFKNDSIDELQYNNTTPQKSFALNFDKSNHNTPKIESEDIILNNRNGNINQDTSGIYSKNQRGSQLNHQEEDLSDDNEDRSPGQTHRTAHFNNQQSMKISKNCKQCFKFDKKGGANKWSVMHLAANQGNIMMLDLLSEANSCPFSLTKFNQTPRKVALQSLILFKILRKYENRWMLKNVLGEEYQSEFQSNDNVVERNIQNLRGFIAETMKRKEHFLHEQLDLFDDKEFGYSIKENLQNNKAQNPRNKENDNESDEDEVLDPELSFEKAATFKFNGMLASQGNQMMETISGGSSLIIPPNSGTLKPQQFGSILRQNSKGQSGQKNSQKDDNNILLKTLGNKKQKVDEDYDDDEDLMNDIDECDEDNDSKFDADDFDEDVSNSKNHKSVNGAARNIAKANINADDRSCVFMRNLPNANLIPSTNSNSSNPLMSMMLNFSEFRGDQKMTSSRQQEIEEQQKQIEMMENAFTNHFFTDIQSLESDKFGQEVERLKNHFLYENTIFQETLNVLQLLQIIHIRLSQRNMKFVSDRGTLPRNVHIMNEFLHSKMDQSTIISQKEFLPSLIASFLHDLLDRIRPLPEIDPDQGTTYFQFNKISQVNRNNQLINLLIIRTRDVLCNLNCLNFFNDFFQKCLEIYNVQTTTSKKNHIVAFSTCDYTNTTFLDYENMQNQCFINATKPIVSSINNSYQIVGSPSYYYQQKQEINSRSSRKSSSQSASEMIKLTQQNMGLVKNQKGMQQNQNIISQRPPANPKGSSSQSQKQNIQNLNLPQSQNKQIHSSTSIENNNSRMSSNNSRNSYNHTSDTQNKHAQSFIQESTYNQKQSIMVSSNAVNPYQPQMKQQTEPNTNYRSFPKSSNDIISQNNQVVASQFIQLSSRVDEPKMPNELKKIDLNTFGVNNIPQQQNQSQYNQHTTSTLTKNYSQNSLSQNQQPPGPKNLKNNNTTFITKPNTEETQSGIQATLYKSTQGRNIESSTTASGLFQSQGHQKSNTSSSFNPQDIIHNSGQQKNQFQQFNQLHQDSKQKQMINSSIHKPQVNQSYQYETNHNKISNDINKSYVYIPSTQPSQNQQYNTSKQYMSNSNQPDTQLNLQNNQNIYSKETYNNAVKHAKSEVHTPQNYSTNTSKNKEQTSFSEKFRKNQKSNLQKNGEENISDEDLSDDSSKQRTQEASKKYSDYKMQFSPFNQKI